MVCPLCGLPRARVRRRRFAMLLLAAISVAVSAGFSIVADINPDGSSDAGRWRNVFNNALYFGADDGTSGNELWKYDGVNAPSMVADINPMSNSGSSPVSARAPAAHAAAGVTRTRVWARARMPPWLPPTHARLSDEPPHGACSRSHSSRRNI